MMHSSALHATDGREQGFAQDGAPETQNGSLDAQGRTHIRVALVSEDIEMAMRLGVELAKTSAHCSIHIDGEWLKQVDATQGLDVVILDAQLRFATALDLARSVRERSRAGLIMLSMSNAHEDRVQARLSGVDHILAKPVNTDELVAIVRNFARFMESGAQSGRHEGENDKWALNHVRWTLIAPGNTEISLSVREYSLLAMLMAQPGIQRSREELDVALRTRKSPAQSRSLDVLVSKLRARIERDTRRSFPLRSVRGVGYAFVGTTY